MKTIKVEYWDQTEIPGLNFTNPQIFDYSFKKRDSLLDEILAAGYAVHVRQINDELLLYINSDKFIHSKQ